MSNTQLSSQEMLLKGLALKGHWRDGSGGGGGGGGRGGSGGSAADSRTLADQCNPQQRAWLGAVLLHHVALVAPQRVIAFGSNVLPLLGHAPTQNTATFPQVNHEGFSCPLLGAGDLAMLLERPAAKARFWQNWLDFSNT